MNKRFKAPNFGWFKPCFFLDYAFTPLNDFKLYKLEKLFYITIENRLNCIIVFLLKLI